METINYKFEQFEGPLELLLTLVSRHRMKIEDIPIDLLCEQYMAYISEASRQNIELACEFLSMASELMLIKSRMLLPRAPENPEDPRAPLINALLEYQKAKLAASELSDRFAEYGSRMVKEPDDISPDRTYVAPHHVELLRAALLHVLSESKEAAKVSPKETFDNIVNAPQVPLQTVIHSLIDRLRQPDILYLDGYFTAADSRSALIAKFIGILELLKSHIIGLTFPCDAPLSEDGITDVMSHIQITLIASEEDIRTSALEWE
ncbi:MAG: segregation/condensation protein A [Clostridia bacterium]|nr:segregation/condensation protein A [Clostridia bacterium]